MIVFLRGLFLFVLVSMVAATSWAGARCNLFAVPHEVYAHPWFIATLFDTYWGFITFFVWVCCKLTAGSARAGWLVAILLLGNIAMASFCLRELFRVPTGTGMAEVLTARRNGADALGWGLAALGILITGGALVVR